MTAVPYRKIYQMKLGSFQVKLPVFLENEKLEMLMRSDPSPRADSTFKREKHIVQDYEKNKLIRIIWLKITKYMLV